MTTRAPRKPRLPPIQEVKACRHCGNDDEFYVLQHYSGQGAYRRCFDGSETDNTQMYDCLNHTASKTAFCGTCHEPVARWDEEVDQHAYQNPQHFS